MQNENLAVIIGKLNKSIPGMPPAAYFSLTEEKSMEKRPPKGCGPLETLGFDERFALPSKTGAFNHSFSTATGNTLAVNGAEASLH